MLITGVFEYYYWIVCGSVLTDGECFYSVRWREQRRENGSIEHNVGFRLIRCFRNMINTMKPRQTKERQRQRESENISKNHKKKTQTKNNYLTFISSPKYKQTKSWLEPLLLLARNGSTTLRPIRGPVIKGWLWRRWVEGRRMEIYYNWATTMVLQAQRTDRGI